MKRIILSLLLSMVCIGAAWAAYQVASPAIPPASSLSRYVPSGAVLYLQAKDFSSLLADWNASPQKRQWLVSSNYEVFSRSRLFLRLNEASGQFTDAAGLPTGHKFRGRDGGFAERAGALRYRQAAVPLHHAARFGKFHAVGAVADALKV